MKILSIHDLEKIRKSAATALRLREESNDKVTENLWNNLEKREK